MAIALEAGIYTMLALATQYILTLLQEYFTFSKN